MGEYSLEAVTAKNGQPSLKMIFNDREIWLHSKYNPEEEGNKWAKTVQVENADQCLVVMGCGLGYHINALKELYPKNEIIVIELLELNDLKISLNNDVSIYIYGQETKLLDFVLQHIDRFKIKDLQVLQYQPVLRALPELFIQMYKDFLQALYFVTINANTTDACAQQWTENAIRNLPYIIKDPGVNQLYNKFTGIPAVIVSAGPSLNKNLPLLGKLKGKALIFTVGAALRLVQNAGVVSDFIVSIDGGEANYRHFAGVNTGESILAYYPLIYHKILEEYHGSRVTMDGMGLLSPKLAKLTGEKGYIQPGPSVANFTFDLALKFGCNPIAFIGQDLAYTSGMTHARGTTFASKVDINPEVYKEVEGYYGGKVFTTHPLNTMRVWLERAIADLPPQVEVFNATEGGAKISGAKHISLREYINSYGQKDYPLKDIVTENIKVDIEQEAKCKKDLIKFFNQMEKDLKKVIILADKGIKYSKKLVKCKRPEQQQAIDDIVQKLGEIGKKVNKYHNNSLVLNLIFQPLWHALEFAFANNDTDVDEVEIIANKSRLLYNSIRNSAEKTESLLNQVNFM